MSNEDNQTRPKRREYPHGDQELYVVLALSASLYLPTVTLWPTSVPTTWQLSLVTW